MKALLVMLVVVLGVTMTAPALAQEGDTCVHDIATIAALRECVRHAVEEGHIDKQAIAQSLLAKLDDAQGALDQGQIDNAIDALNAFVRNVQAQSGKHIVVEHASHLIEHAQLVIAALSG